MGSIFRNKKTGKDYCLLIERNYIKNATNKNEGQRMILYSDGEKYYVREYKEFYEKFEQIK